MTSTSSWANFLASFAWRSGSPSAHSCLIAMLLPSTQLSSRKRLSNVARNVPQTFGLVAPRKPMVACLTHLLSKINSRDMSVLPQPQPLAAPSAGAECPDDRSVGPRGASVKVCNLSVHTRRLLSWSPIERRRRPSVWPVPHPLRPLARDRHEGRPLLIWVRRTRASHLLKSYPVCQPSPSFRLFVFLRVECSLQPGHAIGRLSSRFPSALATIWPRYGSALGAGSVSEPPEPHRLAWRHGAATWPKSSMTFCCSPAWPHSSQVS
jgi:hypothetical protein